MRNIASASATTATTTTTRPRPPCPLPQSPSSRCSSSTTPPPGKSGSRPTTTPPACGSSSPRRTPAWPRSTTPRRSTSLSAGAGSTARWAASTRPSTASASRPGRAGASGRRSTAATSSGSAPRAACARPGRPPSTPPRPTVALGRRVPRCERGDGPRRPPAGARRRPGGAGVLRHAHRLDQVRVPVPPAQRHPSGRARAPDRGLRRAPARAPHARLAPPGDCPGLARPELIGPPCRETVRRGTKLDTTLPSRRPRGAPAPLARPAARLSRPAASRPATCSRRP